MEFFFLEPFRGRLVSVFELFKKMFIENMFFFYQMSLPLPASSPNSTKMKNHSSLIYIYILKLMLFGRTQNYAKGRKDYFYTLLYIVHTTNMYRKLNQLGS